MNGVDQQIPGRFDGDFRIQTVMQQQAKHGAQNQGRQTRIIGSGSVGNEHLRAKVGFFVFSLLVRIYLNNIRCFSFFCQVPEHGSYPLHRQRKDNGIAFVRGDFRQRLQITQLNRFGLFGQGFGGFEQF